MIKQSLQVLRSIFRQKYFDRLKILPGINKTNRDFHIVVSLTSFPFRFKTLHYSIKSLLDQSLKPDVLFLVLTKEEVKDESELPLSILDLKKHGLQIYFAEHNLKPHNKYFYPMKYFPDSLLITVDDDNMYDRNTVKDLYNSYLKFPAAVSAKRVHKIALNNNNSLMPYKNWFYEYKCETEPSFNLLATGVGGVLYPPGIFPPEIFNIEKIKELCLNADDIWLKFMELKNNIPVVWVKNKYVHPIPILKTQNLSLQESNFHRGQNDKYINNLQNHYNIYLSSTTKKSVLSG